jgi:hypothetical protein
MAMLSEIREPAGAMAHVRWPMNRGQLRGAAAKSIRVGRQTLAINIAAYAQRPQRPVWTR